MNAKVVKVTEVGPRDGLQNEKTIIPTEDKVLFIKKLIAAGHRAIEVTSFVGSHKIPQMDDAEELVKLLKNEKLHEVCQFYALVPNLQGLERALKCGIKNIAVFSATSDEFNRKNINTDVAGSMKRIEEVVKEAKKHQLFIRGYISTVFGCPYEGIKDYQNLRPVLDQFWKWNLDEISLGDTIGVAAPNLVRDLLTELKEDYPIEKIAMHFHDTRGMAVANTFVSLDLGIRSFDSSAGGLGGCPYAKGATGNVASEDLWYLFNKMDLETNLDIQKMKEAAVFILKKVGRETNSKFLQSLIKD